tara:strand:+ start:142 stop:375 length:234 start_codon:yes stop_codon:yes gene_type:complete
MTSILEMAEAHVLNVQREIQTLEQRRLEIDKQIGNLTEYLRDGVEAVDVARSDAGAALAQEAASTPNVNNNFNSITS